MIASRTNLVWRPMLVGGLLLASMSTVSADSILVEPGTATNHSFWPFDSTDMRWQQVYDNSFFGTSEITIGAFGFRASATPPAGSITYGADFVVRISTTAAEPGSLSTTFAANAGADETIVLSGPIVISSTPGLYTMFTLTTPFAYDPSQGNLLLDIVHDNSLAGSTREFVCYEPSPLGLERVAIDDAAATDGISAGFGEFVTLFEVTPVPEPSGLMLMLLAICGLLPVRQIKKRTHTFAQACIKRGST